jgi:hypothetical protein
MFIVGKDGRIVYKLVGLITPENFDGCEVEIEKALKAEPTTSRHLCGT